MRNGGCGLFITCCLCCSFLLTLCHCSSVRSLPWETVLDELLQHESFHWAAVLHELHQCRSLPRGAVLQAQPAPAWVPHGVTCPAFESVPVWGPLSTSPQVLAGACSSTGFPLGHSLLWASTCSAWGPFHRLQVGICSIMEVHGLQVHSVPHQGLLHGLQGNVCSSARSTSSPSFYTDLGVCRVVSLSLSHSSLHLQLLCVQQLFPLLKYVITEALPLSLMGSAVASV